MRDAGLGLSIMASSLDAVANGSALRRREHHDHNHDRDHDNENENENDHNHNHNHNHNHDHETDMLRPRPRKIAHSHILIDDHGQVLVNGQIAGLAAEPSIPSGMTSGRSTPVSDNAPPSAKSLSTARKRVRAEQRRRIFPTTDFASRLSHFDPDSDYRDFHGFFNLFWIGLAIMGITTMLRNMKDTGHLMHVQIWSLFTDKLSSLALADFLMVATTAASLPLHRLFRASPAGGALSWARGGMAIQSLFQAAWLAVWIAVPFWFEWTWTAQVFLLLHTMVLLMKMHSYAFYNGHLSETEKRLRGLDVPDTSGADRRPAYVYPSAEYRKGSVSGISLPANLMDGVVDGAVLRQRKGGDRQATNGKDEDNSNSNSNSNSSSSSNNSNNHGQDGKPGRHGEKSANDEKSAYHDRSADREKSASRKTNSAGSAVVDDLREDLARELTSPIGNVTYPRNLSWPNYLDYLLCPTLCYELEYPRNAHINWGQLVSKVIATFGCIFLLTVTSEEFILPVLVDAERRLAELATTSSAQQLSTTGGGITHGSVALETLLVLAETISWLLFPFMLTFLLIFLVIFEYVLGAFAEITCFADRHFYADWWNSTDWMEFSREWNVPVYSFLRRHVYSASRPHTGKHAATVITFLISAVGHEVVMACITKKVRGYGFFCQMLQLPIVMLQRTRWVRGRATLNNVCFWCSMILGLSLICSLYVLI